MKPANLDDRGHWTSASQAQYDLLCPGRHLAQRGLPDTKSEDASAGDRIHAWLATKDNQRADLEPLSSEEQETADDCRAIEEKLLGTWLYAGEGETKCFREERLWIEFGGLKHSGKPDVIYIQQDRALCLDYKTGRNETPIPSTNLQLRDLAVLVASNYGVSEVTVAIVQPWVSHKPEPCLYNFRNLAQSVADMEDRVKASNDPNAERIAGEVQCKWCKAKATCPAFATAGLPQPFESSGAVATPDKVTAAIRAMPGDRLGVFLGLVRLASTTAEQEVRSRLESGAAVDGWKLGKPRVTENISDPQECFNRFVLMGGKTEQFLQAIAVRKTKLKDQVRAVTGTKGKALDGKLAELVEGITESKESAPVLETV